jgi:flagellar assembly protein FliH
LSELHDEPRLVVRVADALLDPLNESLQAARSSAGFEGKIVLLADDSVANGDIRIEWADGGAERDSTRLWREIDEIVARALGHDGANVPAEGTTPAETEISPATPPAAEHDAAAGTEQQGT